MLFTGIIFLFRFLPVFLICYFLAPRKLKNGVLFIGSLLFYAWGEPSYCLLLIVCAAFLYVLGLLVDMAQGKMCTFLTILGVLPTVGVLLYYKYADAFIQGFNTIFKTNYPMLKLALPVGLSVYTLQGLSYLLSVHRGEVRCQKNIFRFALFISMFPLAFTGPILRYATFEEQFADHNPTLEDVSTGLKRFCFGLGKKALLADGIVGFWLGVKNAAPGTLSALGAWSGIFVFGLIVYFAFDGYSDMAIGIGRMLGFDFPENFDHPYMAASVTQFWKKWYMSLGNWFKSEVYVPMGGSKAGIVRQILSVLFVWMLIGMWFGSDWSFCVWGIYFAVVLLLEKMFLGAVLEEMGRPIGMIYTIFVVMLGWVFFAMDDIGGVMVYFRAMFGGNGLIDGDTLYLLREYLFRLPVAVLFTTPIFSGFAQRLKTSGTGYGIALYRLGEKVIPALILLLSIAAVVDAAGNPTMLFGF